MKISVIGAGMVGTDIVSYLFNVGNFTEIVLVDLNNEKSYAEIMDFRHTQSLFYTKNTKLSYGHYEDCSNSDVVIITAGAQVKKGDSRESIAQTNSRIVVDIVHQLEKYTPQSILIFVTNPVDVVTYFAIKESSFPAHRVMSSGTLLDTSRLAYHLSNQFKIDPKNINAFVFGEHGKTCFVPWSLCNIFGNNLDQFTSNNNLPSLNKEEIEKYVIDSGFDIFLKKGNTNHGIAASIYRIVRAIAVNEKSILPVGVYIEDSYGIKDVVLALPAVISQKGIEQVLQISLTNEELQRLAQSADFLKTTINSVNL
ncbi:L-lactate dehydrogenase [Spirochaeta cellobiosiphila]|uniref:L-lactate dehydrogenase n=1 Tax=Spirochaeta cellobiosiphila TaxID=504483 RepID=UPI000428B730|nr:L-lactate dehydrogenase [Spirochaeta cellobiosiphila]